MEVAGSLLALISSFTLPSTPKQLHKNSLSTPTNLSSPSLKWISLDKKALGRNSQEEEEECRVLRWQDLRMNERD